MKTRMRKILQLICLFALIASAQTVSSPASAFCVINKWKETIHGRLKTYNPLGNFHRMIKANEQACCEWFDRSCNPTASRTGQLVFDIRSRSKKPKEFYCSTGLQKRVPAVGGGKITVEESITRIGGLKCNSIDYLSRPVQNTLPPNNYGVPIFSVPNQIAPPGNSEAEKENSGAPTTAPTAP